MRMTTLLLIFSSIHISIYSQEFITWEHLADVTFEEKYFEKTDAYYLFPTFGPTPQKFEGKSVTIKGFMFPLDVEGDFYVLSRYPFSACFFCGMAGPESIVEVQFIGEDRKRYKMDEEVTITGILVLNREDIDHCNYILTQAEEY